MTVVIRELLDRMLHGDFAAARDDAYLIQDIDALGQIRNILEQSTDATERKYCYWILGYLGRNIQSPQVAAYLMERVAAEKAAKLRELALHEVYFFDGISNASHAIAALVDRTRDVRHAAVAALGACRDPKAEEALIGIVNSNDDPVATWKATLALARMGTDRCVDALVDLVRRLPRRKQHEMAVTSALLALTRLGATDVLPIAAAELNASRLECVNLACMLAIWRYGHQDQIDVVIRRIRALVMRKSRQDLEYTWPMIELPFKDEFCAGMSFLVRFEDVRIDGLVAFLRANLPKLFERERRFLAANVKWFEWEEPAVEPFQAR